MLALVAGAVAFSIRFFLGLAELLLARMRAPRNEVREATNVVQAHTINGNVTFCVRTPASTPADCGADTTDADPRRGQD